MEGVESLGTDLLSLTGLASLARFYAISRLVRSKLERPRLRLRLNCIDHYQAAPSAFDPQLFPKHASTQQRDAVQLPVIRVFGATETGQKVCAHIHGALPYLFIEYKGSLDQEELDAYIQQLRVSIDHALAISFRKNIYADRAIYVAHITLVKAVPFYGYHVGYRYFLKIYMLSPGVMTRFADLLYQGAIMKHVIQPYESHLQYLLQWMCDFNLYGCAYIECDQYMFRSPVPGFTATTASHKWHDRSINTEWISNIDTYQRQSHCALEVDICVHDIMNREEVHLRDLHANFNEHFLPLNAEQKLVRSLAGLWVDETKRRKRRMGLNDDSDSPFPQDVLLSMSADSRNTSKGGWIHEEEYRHKIYRLVSEELEKLGHPKLSFAHFTTGSADNDSVQTVLESVEDLFPHKLEISRGSSFETGISAYNETQASQAVVDEAKVSGLEANGLLLGSDDESVNAAVTTDSVQDNETAEMLEAENQALSSPSLSSAENPRLEVTADDGHLPIAKDQNDSRMGAEKATELGAQVSRKRSMSDTRSSEEIARTHPSKRFKTQNVSENLPESHWPKDLSESVNGGVGSQGTHSKHSSPNLSQKLLQGKGSAGRSGLARSFSLPVAKTAHHAQQMSKSGRGSGYQSKGSSISHQSEDSNAITSSAPELKHSTKPAQGSNEDTSQRGSPQASRVAHAYRSCLPSTCSARIFGHAAPRSKNIEKQLSEHGLHPVLYQDAYYSDEKDVPERARAYAGREFRLEGSTTPFLPKFDASGSSSATNGEQPPTLIDPSKDAKTHERARRRCRLRNWAFSPEAPSLQMVKEWLTRDNKLKPTKSQSRGKKTKHKPAQAPQYDATRFSQIEGTMRDFKYSLHQKSTSVRHETQYMSVMSLEVHVNTRNKYVPNPEEDPVGCIFWCIERNDESSDAKQNGHGLVSGILLLSSDTVTARKITAEAGVEVECWADELDLMNRMVDIVREWDPDILTGYEVHNGSWGYLIERARTKFEYDFCDEISRTTSQSHGRFGKETDRWGFNTTSTIRVTGRHMINIWRAMRSELNLLQYTLENVSFHLLHKRVPHYAFSDLTNWFCSGRSRDIAKCINYFLSRTKINLEILDANELVPRTSEQARLIGVDFFSVFSRGSQFKVESFMFRIAKPENFLLVSPSRKQVGQQNALECLPLVMEPQSNFYNSPLLVLDFQSLYPSIMIAYNYCYSTCLGRIVNWRGQNKMGFADFQRQPGLLSLVNDSVNIAPNGMMYVRPNMRKSLLAKMLGEILETRFMVKSGMKVDKNDRTLQKLLNNRQLALKLLANVTYGYTSASFSGRMPCSEIADSIVQTGRETLERAIALIHSVGRWGAEVVYGDTDSLFVYLKGRSRDEAFQIGNEIAERVTKMNPRPVKLKFEKVYHPCVLLAKKRYVGFKYESPSQTVPEFDAKGIETIRRDGTPAEQKIEEKALKILFRTSDLSQVKSYFLRQCTKILSGRVSIQDFCYAREVKLGTYADKGPPPPGALISTRRMLQDPRTEPQYGERVPYVVTTGAPGALLVERCVAPESLLQNENSELDAEYYINKNLIPPLERIFNLVGANVRQWYDEMPKVLQVREQRNQRPTTPQYAPNGAIIPTRKTLEGYMRTSTCAVCRTNDSVTEFESQKELVSLCENCLADVPSSIYTLQMRQRNIQRQQSAIHSICRSCSSLAPLEEVRCDSKDCPVFYSRVRVDMKSRRVERLIDDLYETIDQLPESQWHKGVKGHR